MQARAVIDPSALRLIYGGTALYSVIVLQHLARRAMIEDADRERTVQRMTLGDRTFDLDLGERYPAPEVPFSAAYYEAHQAFVSDLLDDRDMIARFERSSGLPRGFGVGLDERVVEYPWVLSRRLSGRVLDAGSSLNHPHILDRFLGTLEELHIVTLAPERDSFPERGISYLYADLRDLPLRDDLYDAVVLVSTLEHIGMDNSIYGGASERAADPVAESLVALSELRRVLRPGGRLHITVPYGRREDLGWSRQYDADGIGSLLETLGGGPESVTVYAYSAGGWQLSSLDDSAGARYRDRNETSPAADRAAAARAVACLDVEPGNRRRVSGKIGRVDSAIPTGSEPHEESRLLARILPKLEHRSVVHVGAGQGSFARAMLRAAADEIHAVESDPRNVEFLRARFHEEPRVTVHDVEVGAEDGTESRSLASLAAAGELPPRIGVLKVTAGRRDLGVLTGLGALDCDVIAVEHWLDLPEPLLQCPWSSQELVATLSERGFGHFAFVVDHGDLTVLRWEDGTVSAGEFGSLVFLHDRVLADALPEVLESSSLLARRVLDAVEARLAVLGRERDFQSQVADERIAMIEEVARERDIQTAAAAERLRLIEKLAAEIADHERQ